MTDPRPKRDITRSVLVWRHIKCRLTETRDFMQPGWTQIEIEVVSPKGAPIPITETGNLAHYLGADELSSAGGVAAFFTSWLDRDAATKRYATAEFAWRQGSLF